MASLALNKKLQVRILLLGCLLLLLIIRPWQLYFLNDDFIHIPTGALFVRGGFMRPMPNLLVALDKLLYGKKALGFFITSLLLHFSCVFIVFHLARAILKNYFVSLNNNLFPFITAALFLCYPFHAEPLMWLISRVSIMVSILSFGALIYYMNAGKSWANFGIAWLLFVLALFTYESVWNLVFVFACIGFANIVVRKFSWRKELLLLGIMAVTFLSYIALRIWALDTVAGTGYDEINDNLSRYGFLLLNLLKLTGRNFTPPFINSAFSGVFFLASLVLYTYCVYKLFKKNKQYGLLAIILWLCMISGVITAAALGIDTHYNESERYIYYSSGFYCLFLGLIITVLIKKQQLLFTSILSTVFLMLLFLVQKNYVKASVVAKQTLQLTAEHPSYRRAFFADVPARYKGTVLFRTGLKDAIRWINPQCNYDTAIILSGVENPPVDLPFQTGEKIWKEIASQKNWDLQMPVVADSTGKMYTLTKSDVLFWFKPGGIYHIQLPD